MKTKPFANFKVDDTVKTEQEPSKTNYSALEAIRQEQMKGREQRPENLNISSTISMVTGQNFNEWSKEILGALK